MNNDFVTDSITPYENALKERLDDYGFEHSCGASALACSLATLYNVDPKTALIAGLLHDWDRCIPNDILVLEAREYGLALDDVLLASPHLLHAHTGARSAQKHFAAVEECEPLTDEIVQAIANHTVGSTTMSDLDMVVYVADMLEPSRSFPTVDTLREMMGTVSLKALFLQCYQRTMHHLVKNRKLIHPDTLNVWNHYMGEINIQKESGVVHT